MHCCLWFCSVFRMRGPWPKRYGYHLSINNNSIVYLGQNGKFSQNGKFGQNGMSGQKGKVHLGPNVSSSAHYCGCVVNGSGAMAAI